MRRTLSLFAFLLIALISNSASAQQSADIIRGRITGPDSQPIVNASINVVSAAGGISKTTKTDRNGRFSVIYANGEGDYFVYVSAIGFQPQRFQVKRIADEEILLADKRLSAAQLETVNVTAQGPRQAGARTDNTQDVSRTDRGVANANVNAADAGNLAALAASLPGFQLIPGLDGNPDLFSALGLSPDQNNSTLNGANGGADLPRDAGVSTSVGFSNWDVSQGGFSGAQVRIQTRSGNNYKGRNFSTEGSAPQLQWTDNIGSAVSAENSRISLGGRVEGPIKLDKSFYNVSYQFDHSRADFQNLFNTDPLGLLTAGVAPDSVTRLRSVLQDRGIPMSASDIPGIRATNSARLQAAFDFPPPSPSSGSQFQVAAIGNFQTQGALGGNSLLSAPSVTGEAQRIAGVLSARHTNFLWSKVSTQTWLTGSLNSMKNDPYLNFPSGNVRVTSELEDTPTSVRSLTFGGRPLQESSSSTAFGGARNQLQWYSENNKHAIKLTSEARIERNSQDILANQLGSFSFLSLADLEANRPSGYSRTLTQTHEKASQLVGSLSLGDAWRPTPTFQMQYGVRLDANQFLTEPDFNPAIEETFGVRNDIVPNQIYPSARAGFSWQYGTAPQIPFQQGFVSGPRALIAAGIGVFQNVASPDLISQALSSTGLPGSSLTLICSGPATPIPDWESYRTNPFGAPMECGDGTSPFATNVPSVSMFDSKFKQSRSLRSSVSWAGAVIGNRFNGSFTGTHSLNFNQQGSVDLNLDATEEFALASEGNRPVFVPTTAIDPLTGAVASRESRISDDFNRVTSRRSDLRSTSSQLSVNLSPLNFNQTRFTWNVGYTLQYVRERYNGFNSTVGDPFGFETGVNGGSRHQIQYSLSYNFWDYFSVFWRGGFYSGQRFTPMVAGDINGDNTFGNDRAFVFDPASGDPTVAAGMQSLLVGGSDAARECLQSQLGRLSTRNSCVGPWSASADLLQITIHPIKLKLPPRANINFSISNPLYAFDLLFNGSDNAKGWGQPKAPDQNLLFVRGFDPATQRYQYEVNQRFGATSTQQTTQRIPVVVTARISLDIGPTRDWQGLKMQLDRGRKATGNRVTEAQLKNVVMGTVTNPMARILQTADILGLTRRQADSLAAMSRGYTLTLDSIWTPVARFYGGLDSTYSQDEAHERFVRGREAAANYLIKVAPTVKKLLTKAQWRRLPQQITNFLEPRYLERVRAGAVSSNLGIPFFF